MPIPIWLTIATVAVAVTAAGFAVLLIAKRGASPFYRSLAALLGATAVMHVGNVLGLLDDPRALLWRRLATMAELFQPAFVLYVGLALMESGEGGDGRRARWRAHAVLWVGVVFAMVGWTDQVLQRVPTSDGFSEIVLTPLGRVFAAYIVIAMALAVAQLEQILRLSRDSVRYHIKFLLIGCGALAAYHIYQSSELLLLSVWRIEFVLMGTCVTALSLSLIGYGLLRNRLRDMAVKAYVSPRVLYGSVTFIVIGVYLLGVGIVGEWIRQTGQPFSGGLGTVVVFGGLVGLVVLVFSRSAKAELKRFISRHFYRSKYDYRAQWLAVTGAFEHAMSSDTILDRLLEILSQTFAADRISIWMCYESDQRFHVVRSINSDTVGHVIDSVHPLIEMMRASGEPVDVADTLPGRGTGQVAGDALLAISHAKLCIPIKSSGELMGFVTLSEALYHERYGPDDCDLLKGIAHHVGVLLAHARLADERQAAAELEALHRFALFCLHDLKNLASRLSLVAQNAEQHGRDPAFQESAMRTVTDTAGKMAALMSKLSLKSYKPQSVAMPELVDLVSLIHETVEPIRAGGGIRWEVDCQPVPPIAAVREQIHQVLLNVVLNAKQALPEGGAILIATAERDGVVAVTVEDTGVGIPSSKLSALFRPAQSTRPGGLGIGLYQCKQIIEAHQGTIRIQSEAGKGTKVEIKLPIYHAPATIDRDGIVRSTV